MEKEKNKKKTLTISGGLGKKVSTSQPRIKQERKPFIFKKKPQGSLSKRTNTNFSKPFDKPNRKNFSRKFAEQQATKRFIHADNKEGFKTKLKSSEKNKAQEAKRELKLTISRAMNVEEFEIKQRSLASVKRARQK